MQKRNKGVFKTQSKLWTKIKRYTEVFEEKNRILPQIWSTIVIYLGSKEEEVYPVPTAGQVVFILASIMKNEREPFDGRTYLRMTTAETSYKS